MKGDNAFLPTEWNSENRIQFRKILLAHNLLGRSKFLNKLHLESRRKVEMGK